MQKVRFFKKNAFYSGFCSLNRTFDLKVEGATSWKCKKIKIFIIFLHFS